MAGFSGEDMFLNSILSEYLTHKRMCEVLYSDLVTHFQCTPDLIEDKLIDVENACFNKMKYWLLPEQEDEYLRRLEVILKNPHYYLYKNKTAIWEI